MCIYRVWNRGSKFKTFIQSYKKEVMSHSVLGFTKRDIVLSETNIIKSKQIALEAKETTCKIIVFI